MHMNQGARMNRVEPAATLAAGERARQLARDGKEVFDLGPSSPYHTTPSHIVEAGVRALRSGLTNISSPHGLPEFRQAMAEKPAALNGLEIDPQSDILVTPGSKQGLFYALNSYIGPGDEVLLVEPTWVSYRQQVELAGGVAKAVPLSAEEEYFISCDALKEHVTPQTRALVINNPNNPTGRVYTQQEMEAVARVALENDLLVVCDETYEYFVYDSHRHLTLATLPQMWERTITSYTFTKAYAMSGWRLGCVVGPASLLEPLTRVHQHTASFVPPFVQEAGIEALRGPQDHLELWRNECQRLRSWASERLNAVPGVHCPLPQGATFVYPRFPGRDSSSELAELLVERKGVVVTPDAAFGDSGEGHIRIALMRSPSAQVVEGIERIAALLEAL